MKKKLYIWGWWQGNNLGDNWIKKTLKSLFPSAQFIDTFVQKFEKNSFVICGGGGLFVHDVVAPWDKVQKNISYGMLGLGAEFPHESTTAIEVSRNAKFFLVRDQYSLDCMHLDNIERSYDLTFSLPLKWMAEQEINKQKVFFVWRDGHELIGNEKFKEYIVEGSSYDEWKEVVDSHFEEIVKDDFQTHDDNIDDRISDCGFVISGRYHGIVAAIQKGLPFIAIDICPKIRALLNDCGLEEYCIKISEIDKVEGLIEKARIEVDEIRTKERAYLNIANATLKNQIEDVQLEILKELKPLNVVYYVAGVEEDGINTMGDDLEKLCNLKKFDLKIHSQHPDKRVRVEENILDDNKVVKDINRQHADVIILNTSGIHLSENIVADMRKRNIIAVGISRLVQEPELDSERYDLFYTSVRYWDSVLKDVYKFKGLMT